jgi:hypothetical protein
MGCRRAKLKSYQSGYNPELRLGVDFLVGDYLSEGSPTGGSSPGSRRSEL